MNWRTKLSEFIDGCFFQRRLKRRLAETEASLETLRRWVDDMHNDDASARAQLMQLRVHGESIRGRTGFMVSAFIPNGVLERLRAGTERQKSEFQQRVVTELVALALRGIFRVSNHGTMQAMIFAPVSKDAKRATPSAIFETRDGSTKVEHYVSEDLRRIKSEEQRMLGSGGV